EGGALAELQPWVFFGHVPLTSGSLSFSLRPSSPRSPTCRLVEWRSCREAALGCTANRHFLRFCTARPRSLPLIRVFPRFRPLRHEVRLISQVNDDHAVRFLAIQLRPAPACPASWAWPKRPSSDATTGSGRNKRFIANPPAARVSSNN